MELRHLRYFVAVAEAGGLTVAAREKAARAQPSLSRQTRDLEYEVGTQRMTRNARGIELAAAGTAFLDHARLALIQVEAAGEAALRAAKPNKLTFALGFLTGQEIDWLPKVMRVLRDELPNIEVTQLDVLWQRPWRQHCRSAAEFLGFSASILSLGSKMSSLASPATPSPA